MVEFHDSTRNVGLQGAIVVGEVWKVVFAHGLTPVGMNLADMNLSLVPKIPRHRVKRLRYLELPVPLPSCLPWQEAFEFDRR